MRAKARLKPIAIKVGNVTVKIYRTRTHGCQSFQVADYSTGKRKFLTFSDEQRGRAKASEIATKLANREGEVLSLTSNDRAAYLRSLELLQPTGAALEVAAAVYADAHQKLNGRSIGEAVNFFSKRNPSNHPSKTVAEVCDEMIEAKKADGASAVYLKDLDFRLGKFADAFQCQIATVSAAEINAFLRIMECRPRTRNNARMVISTLFKFAQARDYLAKDHVDFDKVPKAREGQVEIEIFTPKEMTALLKAARIDGDDLIPGWNRRYATGPGLLPLLTLGAFAGLRTAEIERQKWSDINLERGFIRVTAAKGNTASKRLVPISDNLKQWLTLCGQSEGLCSAYGRSAEAIARLSKRAKVKWKHNGLRHSFISYRVAETQDIPRVSLEAGNSPRMIFKHYRELVTADEAEKWFSIRPKAATKIDEVAREEAAA